ncbi:aminoacyl-tRNA hydrolase [Bacteroidota bacterium]
MKFLIVGLGNTGDDYEKTRHNIGFQVLDAMAEASGAVFSHKRYANVCEYKFKARTFILVKPTTYVNLSGKAVNYWLKKEKIPLENLLIILDDIALPFGTIRIKEKGGDAGHNGLINISIILGHENYQRLRFGIGNDFPYGNQADFVLSKWTDEESIKLPERIDKIIEAIKSFATIGISRTMNQFNNS